MAVDSASKRFSMMGFRVPTTYLSPVGSINAAQRATLLNLYNGVPLTLEIVPPPNIDIGVSCLIGTTAGVSCLIGTTAGVSCAIKNTKGVTSGV